MTDQRADGPEDDRASVAIELLRLSLEHQRHFNTIMFNYRALAFSAITGWVVAIGFVYQHSSEVEVLIVSMITTIVSFALGGIMIFDMFFARLTFASFRSGANIEKRHAGLGDFHELMWASMPGVGPHHAVAFFYFSMFFTFSLPLGLIALGFHDTLLAAGGKRETLFAARVIAWFGFAYTLAMILSVIWWFFQRWRRITLGGGAFGER